MGEHGNFKHGSHKYPEYRNWLNARDRCRNPNTPYWYDYGGRGIEFDSRWDDFIVFLADMGRRPSSAHSLDRIDNDGNYEPGNCRWATSAEQNKNRRTRVSVAAILRYTTLTHEDLDWIREQMGAE